MSLDLQLRNAAFAGDLIALQDTLARGADVNATDEVRAVGSRFSFSQTVLFIVYS